MKPFSEACAENQGPILEILRRLFAGVERVLEVGSGTGQHAVCFGAALSHLRWQTSDLPEHHAGIRAWLAEAGLENVLPPLALDVRGEWPAGPFDAVFSANTTHILSWPEVEAMFRGIGQVLAPGGCLALYGPFNLGGRYTSPSNARFDQWLRARDPRSGLRDLGDLIELGRAHGLEHREDITMPVNNRILVWRRSWLAS